MKEYKILLVDDDPLILKGVGKYLEKKGYQVTTTDNGEKAIKLLEDSTFDLVITDLVMEHINGIQVLKESKRLNPDVMNIILTGHGDMESTIDALRLDADDYLLKPCGDKELDYRIASCLEKLELKLKVKRAEEEIRKAKSLESLGILSGGIAHDFNNLLSIIVGNIELAKDDIAPEAEASGSLDEAKMASLKALELTKQLITFSEGGAPVKETGSIEDLVKEIADASLSDSEVKCEFIISSDLYAVRFDKGQMNHAIQNIIVNAVESMSDSGSITVKADNFTITTERDLTVPEGHYVRISIRDQGVGIPEEHLSKIFDPYFSTKERGTQKGMGLGLAVTYSVVSKHNGHVAVESEVGVGTTFHIYLPAVEAEGMELRANAKYGVKGSTIPPGRRPLRARGNSRQSHRGVGPYGPEATIANHQSPIINHQSPRVLVMDDEEMIRNLSRQTLSRLGYEPALAKDGAEAVELYGAAKDSGKPFDIVILDLTIKGGAGGKEVIKKLMAIDPDIKAIISSGYPNDPVMTDFKAYGFAGALPKPHIRKDLIDMLTKVTMGKV